MRCIELDPPPGSPEHDVDNASSLTFHESHRHWHRQSSLNTGEIHSSLNVSPESQHCQHYYSSYCQDRVTSNQVANPPPSFEPESSPS